MMRPIITTACCSGSRGRCRKRICTFSRRVCWQAGRAKAQRGELGKPVPMGYVQGDGLRVMSRSIPMNRRKRQYDWCSICSNSSGPFGKVMTYLVEHDIKMPIRVAGRLRKGELEWHRVNRPSLYNLFANPIYVLVLMRMACVRPIGGGRSRSSRHRAQGLAAIEGAGVSP